MLDEGVRVPGVPVVKTDTSGGGVGGGGSSTYCTRQYYYRSLSDAIASRCPYDGELQGLVGCRWPVLSCWRRV